MGISRCSPVSSERHRPSGVNNRFSFKGESFGEYVLHERKVIEQGRTDLTPENRERVIEGNSPFVLVPNRSCPPGVKNPYRKGILLAHGLTDSPYTMRALGRFFQGECFYVEAILLPGHGTRPGDLLDVTWEEWDRAFSFGLNTLKKEADDIYIGGFSTGGTLAIYHSMQDRNIRGLFLFSPAVKVDQRARYTCELSSLTGVVPSLAWIGKLQPDNDPFKYESFASNAACQIFRLTKKIEPAAIKSPLKVPLFIAASADDFSVKTDATLQLFERATSPHKLMLLYARGRRTVPEGVEVVESSIPDKKILGSSHMGIVQPPGDPYYGEEGINSYCIQYYGRDGDAYRRCMAHDEDYLGEISKKFMSKGVLRRLTYNPHFEGMLKSLRQFIRHLP